MIDKIILGLLTKCDLTSYDIKIAMDKSISKFYSSSFGSLNPALKKLEKAQQIHCVDNIENNRLKRVYQITDLGKTSYSNWLSTPIKIGRFKDESLIKLFFLGDATTKERTTLINDYILQISEAKNEYQQLKTNIEQSNLTTEQLENCKYQLSTLQYGIDYLTFKKDWFENYLLQL